jgi:hypothetical protein
MFRWLGVAAALGLLLPAAARVGVASEVVPRVYQEEFHLRADRDFQLPGWRTWTAGQPA